MTKLRYSFGGAAVRQPCAGCIGAGYERSTEPLERLPILGGRHTHNDERNPTGTALAGDKLGTDHGLLFASSGQHAPGGKYRRRMGSCADGGAGGGTLARCWRVARYCAKRYIVPRMVCCRKRRYWQRWGAALSACDNEFWRQQTHAHRQQVHSLLYVEMYRLTPKGVAA